MIHASDYLSRAAALRPDSIAYVASGETLTCAQAHAIAQSVGVAVAAAVPPGSVVAVLAERTAYTPAMFFGVLYAGCCYAPLSPELPHHRIQSMLMTSGAQAILTDGRCDHLLLQLSPACPVIRFDENHNGDDTQAGLPARLAQVTECDPCIILFTSGSSGIPKGVALPHRAIIDAVDVYASVFSIGPGDVLGAQSPLDYVAAIRDVFLPPAVGCRSVFIPRKLFSTPAPLFDFLNDNAVTTLFWAAPALSLCAELGVFSSKSLDTVNKVIFTGSVLPIRHLMVWMEHLPRAYFANHYGPTEITGSCIYYEVKGIADSALSLNSLPIGKPFPNVRIHLLDEHGNDVPTGELGEICISGTRLALGYIGAPEQTGAAFVLRLENGLAYVLYRTGDLGRRDAQGVFTFHGRSDSQIKHMGHRIELSEIESLVAAMRGVSRCVCLYDGKQIWLLYEGGADAKSITLSLRESLPSYMIPRRIRCLDSFPLTPGGKPDRKALGGFIQRT